MPADETAPTPPRPVADDASRVGWFLTAVTGAVVLVGLAVINYVTGSRPRDVSPVTAPVEPLVEVLPDTPPPLVVRPSEPTTIEVAEQRETPPLYR